MLRPNENKNTQEYDLVFLVSIVLALKIKPNKQNAINIFEFDFMAKLFETRTKNDVHCMKIFGNIIPLAVEKAEKTRQKNKEKTNITNQI